MLLEDMKPSKRRVLDVPAVMEELIPVNLTGHKQPPAYQYTCIDKEWFQVPNQEPSTSLEAKAKDFAFIVKHYDDSTNSS